MSDEEKRKRNVCRHHVGLKNTFQRLCVRHHLTKPPVYTIFRRSNHRGLVLGVIYRPKPDFSFLTLWLA